MGLDSWIHIFLVPLKKSVNLICICQYNVQCLAHLNGTVFCSHRNYAVTYSVHCLIIWCLYNIATTTYGTTCKWMTEHKQQARSRLYYVAMKSNDELTEPAVKCVDCWQCSVDCEQRPVQCAVNWQSASSRQLDSSLNQHLVGSLVPAAPAARSTSTHTVIPLLSSSLIVNNTLSRAVKQQHCTTEYTLIHALWRHI